MDAFDAAANHSAATGSVSATTLTSGVASTVTWTIPNTPGSQTIYARFKDGASNPSAVYTTTVILEMPATSEVPTLNEWMLNPRRRKSDATRLSTPGWSST